MTKLLRHILGAHKGTPQDGAQVLAKAEADHPAERTDLTGSNAASIAKTGTKVYPRSLNRFGAEPADHEDEIGEAFEPKKKEKTGPEEHDSKGTFDRDPDSFKNKKKESPEDQRIDMQHRAGNAEANNKRRVPPHERRLERVVKFIHRYRKEHASRLVSGSHEAR